MALRQFALNALRGSQSIGALLSRANPSTSHMNKLFSSSEEPTSEEVATPEKENFHLRFNVEHFSPEDLQIKVIGNILVIEGMHGEKEDEGGVIRRYFVRKYTIPECFDTEKVLSSLSKKGILDIQAPLKKCTEAPVVERTIPIQKNA